MTYRCNHQCLFCSCPWEAPAGAWERQRELSRQEWEQCLDMLIAKGITSIAFTGGEPLLYPHTCELIARAAGMQAQFIETKNGVLESWYAAPKLYLLSNGSAMTEQILELCRTHDVHLSMSLPGLITFREHTQGGDPQKVLAWFRKAHEMGVHTTVGVTVTRKNLHELFETISEALLAGADTLLMNRFLPGGRGLMHDKELLLSAAQVVEMLDIAEDVLRKANRFGSVGTELPKCLVDLSRYQHLKVGTRCSAALEFFVIDPSGYVRVCNHSQVRLHHFTEIDKVKDHPYWKTFVSKDYLPGECVPCPDMCACDGGCREAAHIAGGRIDARDPLLEGCSCPPRKPL